jgi:hypothetical protein
MAKKLANRNKIYSFLNKFCCEVMAQEMKMEIDSGSFSYLFDCPSEQMGSMAVWNIKHSFGFSRLFYYYRFRP